MTTRTPAQNPTSDTESGYPPQYNWGTNETAPGGVGAPWFPGPCRLTRSRLVTHHCTPILPAGITQMGGSGHGH